MLLLVAGAAIVASGALDGLTLARLQAMRADLQAHYAAAPVATLGAFMALFILLFAFLLPAGSIMSLAGGAIFGFPVGVLAVSFASTIGATLAFWLGRYLLADTVRRHAGGALAAIDRGLAQDGPRYLFSLRLLPIFPPALLSLFFGLTRLRTVPFYVATQLGGLLGTVVYVNAGTQLAQVHHLGDILTLPVLASMAAVAGAPWLLKRWLRSRATP